MCSHGISMSEVCGCLVLAHKQCDDKFAAGLIQPGSRGSACRDKAHPALLSICPSEVI